jgi:lysyl-tRNA synthetase class 1
MFWADKLLENPKEEEWVNDSTTPSGIIHMGSLKGPIIHDVLFRILKEKGINAKFTYGFDDMDVIDGLPSSLAESLGQYMGVPIYKAPSPDGNGSFGEHFSNVMKNALERLGIEPEIYKTSDMYLEGKFDEAIRFVLDNADKVRKVYSEMYNKELPSDWYPFQVECPTCGKLGTTRVTGWDGNEVEFECSKTLVKWAEGCETKGKISPFGGNGKMPWKVEWAAKWWAFGVTIEGAGKDHASAGGSYDVARKIVVDVFNQEPPLRLPYEFFLYDGKKMSSSKGLGLTGQELLEVLPPEIVRFLMIKNDPNTAVEFNPFGTQIIPKLIDDYQRAANEYEQNTGSDASRAFELSCIGDIKLPPKFRFLTLAQWVQMPNMEEQIKKEGLTEWAKYARVWVEKYAPESDKFLIQKDLPDMSKLTEQQKGYLTSLRSLFEKDLNAEELQTAIYEMSKESGIPSIDAFKAIYTAFLGKDHGPKAAWLLQSLDRDFVKSRLDEASKASAVANPEVSVQALNKPEIFSIDRELMIRFPSISVGVAIIRNAKIEKTNTELEKAKEEVLKSLEGLTTEELGEFSETQSYRRLYKEMGVDWHSRRPSPEALLRRVALKKGLYTINTCVDAYNLVVMKNSISIGAFDLDKLRLPTVLRTTKADESILLLGDEEPTYYSDKEIAYFDQDGGYNMDFNYRDAQRTAVQLNTKNILIDRA